jgi:hypothetical protein
LPRSLQQNKERTMLRVNYWEIIADNLSKAGWTWGGVSAMDSHRRTIFVADAHPGDGKRFVVRADEKLAAFVQLESQLALKGWLSRKRRVSRLWQDVGRRMSD